MTSASTDDLVRDFRDHLPPWAARALMRTKRVEVAVYRAIVTNGWTADLLAAHATRGLEHHYAPGGVITTRLDHLSNHPPPATASKPAARPFCSPECEQRRGWIEDDHGIPVRKCPCRSTP